MSVIYLLCIAHELRVVAGGRNEREQARRDLHAEVVREEAARLKEDESTMFGKAGRSAHWVLRSSDLQDTITFLGSVFEMHVIRHEENPDACPLTCNGRFNASWSKTMVGYAKENVAYSLEITYNYGISDYKAGSGLQEITIGVTDTKMALSKAKILGYKVEGELITGPDKYVFRVRSKAKRKESFLSVTLHVNQASQSALFYTQFLGMQAIDMRRKPSGYGHDQWTVGYSDSQPSLILTERPKDAAEIQITQWEGRHAIALPENTLRVVYARIEAGFPHLVVHPLREIREVLGVLLIAIVKDEDGYEICLVSSETFDKAVSEAADFKPPDWELRRRLLIERAVGGSTATTLFQRTGDADGGENKDGGAEGKGQANTKGRKRKKHKKRPSEPSDEMHREEDAVDLDPAEAGLTGDAENVFDLDEETPDEL
jgi:catechol 2,3-dioxygenase-like lactoylglutathione lyase family enzyme